jgi:hypothetical protein
MSWSYTGGGCKVKINSYTVDSTFSGSYYSDLDTIITAVLPEGKALDYWMVNEQRVDGDKLIINSSLIKKNKAKVSFVTK